MDRSHIVFVDGSFLSGEGGGFRLAVGINVRGSTFVGGGKLSSSWGG